MSAPPPRAPRSGKRARIDTYGETLFGLQGPFPRDDEVGLGVPVGTPFVAGLDDPASIHQRQRRSLGSAVLILFRIMLATQGAHLNCRLHGHDGRLVSIAEHEGVLVDATLGVGHVLGPDERQHIQETALGAFSLGSDHMLWFTKCVDELRRFAAAEQQIYRNARMELMVKRLRKERLEGHASMFGSHLG